MAPELPVERDEPPPIRELKAAPPPPPPLLPGSFSWTVKAFALNLADNNAIIANKFSTVTSANVQQH